MTSNVSHPGGSPSHTIAPRPKLDMFTIYQDPPHFPGKVVVRHWWCEDESDALHTTVEPLVVVGSVDEARAAIIVARPGTHPIKRSPEDHPTVIETWL